MKLRLLCMLAATATIVAARATPRDDNNTSGTATANGGEDDDDHYSFDNYQFCDYSRKFKNLDELQAAATSGSNDGSAPMRSDCIAVYSVQALLQMLDDAEANYTAVNDGYDAEFNYYVTYMLNAVDSILKNQFMFDMSKAYPPGGDDPNTNYPNGTGLNFFDCEASGVKFPCQEMYFWKRQELMWDQTTTMTLRDEDGFNKALVEYGLSPDMVVLSPDSYDYTQTQRWGGSIHNCNYHIVGFPTRNPDMKVANPKDIVTKGLGSIADLRIQMQATMLDMMLGTWSNGSTNDPAQAYSAPVFLLMQGVESMAQAKALGVVEQEKEKEDAEKQKELILLIVSVVLMFVPVVGEEVALATGFAGIARTIAILGDTANAALGLYNTVDDPSSAIINIVGSLLGLGKLAKMARDGEGISEVAQLRRAMIPEDVKGLGKIFEAGSDSLQQLVDVCQWI